MSINISDYQEAVNSANNSQLLTVHQDVLRERDELKAHVNILRDALKPYAELEVVEGEGANVATNALNKITTQCLAEIKAQAGRDGFIAGYKKMWHDEYGTNAPDYSYIGSAELYADQLRQAAKG